jgi:hypothetical protein
MGVTVGQEGDSLQHLLERADAALYIAKRTGRTSLRLPPQILGNCHPEEFHHEYGSA